MPVQWRATTPASSPAQGWCTSTPRAAESASRADQSAATPARREHSLSRRHLLLDPLVAFLLELQRQLLAALLHDPAVCQDVDEVGDEVRQQPLVVRDHED